MLSNKTIRKHVREYKRDLEFKKSIMICLLEVIDFFPFFWAMSKWDGA